LIFSLSMSLLKLVLEMMTFFLLWSATTSSIILFSACPYKVLSFSLQFQKGRSWHTMKCLLIIWLLCIWLLLSNNLLQMSLLCFPRNSHMCRRIVMHVLVSAHFLTP
jgi:hypothetical protein